MQVFKLVVNSCINFNNGSVSRVFGTAISRFTAVMFKTSSNNIYSIYFSIKIYIYISIKGTTSMPTESLLSRESNRGYL